MEKDKCIIDGIIDLHVHAGPSVMAREVDGFEMLQRAENASYQAFIIKDHFAPSVMTAKVLEMHFATKGTKVFGGISMNNSVGGLNVKALDVACAMGGKIFWMPTVSSLNHIVKHSGHGVKFPGTKGMTIAEKPIVYVDGNGKLIPEAKEVVEYAASRGDIIMGTGHGTVDEINAAIMEGAAMGLSKILVNHPFYLVDADIDHMKAWAEAGAFIELNATVFVPSSKFYATPLSLASEILEKIGPERIVIDSDYGQLNNGDPAEKLMEFIRILRDECGVGMDELTRMAKTNPASLLGI